MRGRPSSFIIGRTELSTIISSILAIIHIIIRLSWQSPLQVRNFPHSFAIVILECELLLIHDCLVGFRCGASIRRAFNVCSHILNSSIGYGSHKNVVRRVDISLHSLVRFHEQYGSLQFRVCSRVDVSDLPSSQICHVHSIVSYLIYVRGFEISEKWKNGK